MRNEVIFLITEKGTEYDADGFKAESEKVRTQVFAEVKTTTYKEYFASDRDGEKVTDIFVVSEDDYNLSMQRDDSGKKIRPRLVEYDGTEYKIVRRYRRATNASYLIELTCVEVE